MMHSDLICHSEKQAEDSRYRRVRTTSRRVEMTGRTFSGSVGTLPIIQVQKTAVGVASYMTIWVCTPAWPDAGLQVCRYITSNSGKMFSAYWPV